MKSEFSSIQYQKEPQIATIVLNHPESRNALTPQMIREYLQALDLANEDPEVRVLILTGAGTAFCAGIDLKYFKDEGAFKHREWMEIFYWQMNDKVRSLNKPIIASLNGPARAAGCTMAFACDMIIAADTATIGYPEVTRAIPTGIHLWYLPRLIGKYKASELLFTGKPISAGEAERIGLIGKVVPCGELERATRELALNIAEMSPVTLKLIKELIFRVENMDFRTAVRTVADTVCLAFDS